eukprot:TRINITY_DN4557_c0_g1_i2.p1 TRINITY_DN4557_c0_g1~~TRINITY_DN4557_c0_g1_i2.p1  ORF type:complete len:325 (-),score=122.58 TRINITY_DN4557_c0_g1_i2:4-978(-)
MHIDNTLLGILSLLSLFVIVGGMCLIWKLTAPPSEAAIEELRKKKKKEGKKVKKEEEEEEKETKVVPEKKDTLSRMRRRKQAKKSESSSESEEAQEVSDEDTGKGKPSSGGAGVGLIGAKKLKKLREKEERAQAREAREAIKKSKEEEEDRRIRERMKREKKEEEEERRQEEELERLRKEREKKEQEEYDAMKHMFEVQAAGSIMDDLDEFKNNIPNFIQYIKDSKVVFLEDLASKYHIKTQAVVDKILELEKEGQLSGIIDEKGKFIYITDSEMTSVAQFIKQRGRVHISEIQRQSNALINLEPVKLEVLADEEDATNDIDTQ